LLRDHFNEKRPFCRKKLNFWESMTIIFFPVKLDLVFLRKSTLIGCLLYFFLFLRFISIRKIFTLIELVLLTYLRKAIKKVYTYICIEFESHWLYFDLLSNSPWAIDQSINISFLKSKGLPWMSLTSIITKNIWATLLTVLTVTS